MSEQKHSSIVSVRDIAARIGCSHSSVSRALRGEKKVGPELRDLILKTADEMGYKPNPMVSSLMATQNLRRHRSNLAANIGWLNTHFRKDYWTRMSYTRPIRKAAEERANQLGYGLDDIWAEEEGMTGKRLGEIAQARGIQGFVLPGTGKILSKIEFDPSPFAIVCLGDHQDGQLAWHRAGVSARKNVMLAFRKLQELGYKRIAFSHGISNNHPEMMQKMEAFNRGALLESEFISREDITASLSGFTYMQQFVEKEDRIPPFFFERVSRHFTEAIIEHLERIKPDALISSDSAMLECAEAAGIRVPEEMAIVHTDLGDDVEGWAGINTHNEHQVHATIDLLCAQVERNERGLPRFPKFVHVEGEWVDGWTAPKRA